jgi:hypothetical protein
MSSDGAGRSKFLRLPNTLRISRLLATRLKLVRVEVVGQDHPALARASTFLLYVPFIVVGYAFALAAVAWFLALEIGWGGALLLMGVGHLLVGAWGVRRAPVPAAAETFDVLSPECEPDDAEPPETSSTLLDLYPPGAAAFQWSPAVSILPSNDPASREPLPDRPSVHRRRAADPLDGVGHDGLGAGLRVPSTEGSPDGERAENLGKS